MKNLLHRVRAILDYFSDPFRVAAVLLILASIIVFGLTIIMVEDAYNSSFIRDILVESHGMLYDIFVIAFLLAWLHHVAAERRERKREAIMREIEKGRIEEEIDVLRPWKAPEATYRIAGIIRRLNKYHQFSMINLSYCFLKKAPLREVNLEKANLFQADLEEADLVAANLKNASLESINLKGAYAARANLMGANLFEAFLDNAILNRANLEGANLEFAQLPNCRLGDTILRNTNLISADLSNTSLRNANLENAKLDSADLRGASVTKEQLIKVGSLFATKLDIDLKTDIEKTHKHLFETPSPGY